jgi:hypothetical protein
LLAGRFIVFGFFAVNAPPAASRRFGLSRERATLEAVKYQKRLP